LKTTMPDFSPIADLSASLSTGTGDSAEPVIRAGRVKSKAAKKCVVSDKLWLAAIAIQRESFIGI
jgi:hypothetical protein